MFESTNERTAKVIYTLTTGKGIDNLDRIDMIIAYLLLLVMLIVFVIATPVVIYDTLYERYQRNKAREQRKQ